MNDGLIKVIGSALAGVLLGWGANALTVVGRVAALEVGQTRVEGKLDRLLDRPAPLTAAVVAAIAAPEKPKAAP